MTTRISANSAQVSRTLPSSSMMTLASFTNYGGAEALVDRKSDDGYPVESVRIVGTNLTTVEQVTGRLTKGKALRHGLASGVWFGLFIGVLFSLFTPFLLWWVAMPGSILLGALSGAGFGYFGQLASGGRRDFSAVRSFAVDSYEVQVDESRAASAQKYMLAPTA